MSRKMMRLVLIVGGIAFTLLSLGADFIGIGARPGFHWKQILGIVLGLAAVLVGFWLGKEAEKEK
jgi:hypothetical protein